MIRMSGKREIGKKGYKNYNKKSVRKIMTDK